MTTRPTIVLASGGVHSTVAACRAGAEGGDVHLLFADCRQPTATDRREALTAISRRIGAELTVIDLPHLHQIDDTIQRRTDYAAPPAAGAVSIALLSAGLHLATGIGAGEIHIGTSETSATPVDDPPPPHHRREYLYLANLLVEELQSSAQPVTLKAPLVDMTGSEIIKLGQRLGAPFQLTYSCKRTSQTPCGTCGGCVARRCAFDDARIIDPATTPAAETDADSN